MSTHSNYYVFLSFWFPILGYIVSLIFIRTKRKNVEAIIEQINYPEIQESIKGHMPILYRYPLVLVISTSAKIGQVILKSSPFSSNDWIFFFVFTAIAIIYSLVLTPIAVKIGAYFFKSKISVLIEKFPMHIARLQSILNAI